MATDAREVNLAVAREARERGVWVNAADDPAHCDLHPAGRSCAAATCTVAVATGGTSPALSRAIREELEAYLTAEYATLADARGRGPARGAGGRVAWSRPTPGGARSARTSAGSSSSGGASDAKHRLLELLGVEACAR